MKLYKQLMVAGLVIAATSGCSQKELPVTDTTPAVVNKNEDGTLVPEDDAKLVLWIDNKGYAEAIVAGFNEIYPDVEVQIVEVMDTETTQKIELEGPAGNGADVFTLPHDQFAKSYNSGILLPLDEDIAQGLEQTIMPNALSIVQTDTGTYGVPIITEALAIFYNKDLVEEPATSFEEIFEFAETFNDPLNNQFAFAMNVANAYNAYAFLTPYGFELFGPDGTDVDNPGFDTDAFEQGLEFIAELNTILPVKSLDLAGEFIGEQFKAGKIAYVLDGPWQLETYKQAGLNLGVMTIPTIDGNVPTPFAGVKNVHVSAYTDYPNASMLLAQYMGSEEAANILYETVYKLPALADASVVDGLAEDELLSVFLEQFETAFPMPSVNRISYYWSIGEKAISLVFDGQVTPAEARAAAVTEWNSLVASE
ncbi:MAG: hypothetical protein BEN18_04965 [Epulopiscium sp. Nuni2H_MBin001]|nr:MAG: hypothetical protein BEN18_04965 [Epulopiscium sp. Nuni2H_MBin001]